MGIKEGDQWPRQRKRKRRRPESARSQSRAEDIEAKQAKTYADMEPYLCDLSRMGEIAAMMFDKDDG